MYVYRDFCHGNTHKQKQQTETEETAKKHIEKKTFVFIYLFIYRWSAWFRSHRWNIDTVWPTTVRMSVCETKLNKW